MAKCLTISAIAILGSGCASAPHVPFTPPLRPVFTEYSDPLWESLPLEAIENIVTDDLACKQYIRSNEERAKIHNGEQ